MTVETASDGTVTMDTTNVIRVINVIGGFNEYVNVTS